MISGSTPEPDHAGEPSVEIPGPVGAALTRPDHPILLLVADSVERGAGAAMALADARAARGLATLLADGGVTDPQLHQYLGVDNLEGLADVFLFGASLPRVATRPPDHHFGFVPTGAYIPDPEGVLSSETWDRIATELEGAEAVMLVLVPAATPGLGALSRRIGRAILLADEGEAERLQQRLDRSCRILATVAPRRSAPAAAARSHGEGSEAGEAGDGEVVGAGAGAGGDGALSEPAVVRTGPGLRATPTRLILLAGLVLMLAVVGVVLYRQYSAPTQQPVAAADPAPEPAAEPARGEPVETPIPISVAVEVHQDLLNARERVAALRGAEPEVDFYLAPVAVSGGLYYRLLAGPVADPVTGTALLQRLVDAGHKTAFDSWAVRPTEYAFLLGDFESREEADARVAALDEQDIPAYVVTIRYEPGPPGYRVYGGAFETAVEAEVMGELLENAGVEASLVPRTGEPIA